MSKKKEKTSPQTAGTEEEILEAQRKVAEIKNRCCKGDMDEK